MKRIGITLIIVLLCGMAGIAYAQTWQETLEEKFDTVSTFDELQDWTGIAGIGDATEIVATREKGEMPKLLDGTSSIWQYYANWVRRGVAVGPWIGDQGHGNVWSGKKSLRLDYANAYDTPQALGPSRLGTYFGNGSPSSGYDDIYVFYMTKYPPNFFARLQTDNNKFAYFDYLKTLVISAGFRAVFAWGTPEQQARAIDVQGAGCYGLNYFIFNATAQSATYNELKIANCLRVSNDQGTSVIKGGGIAKDISLSSCVRNHEWFGIEYYVHRGTPCIDSNGIVQFSDGKVEIWLYNSNGQIIGHNLFEHQVHIRVFGDHRYNRIVLGGNRSWGNGDLAYTNNGHVSKTPESHVYIDDFIIHGKRIGPQYFFLKLGGVMINSGAEKAFSEEVTLTLNAPEGTTRMQISNDGINWEPEEDFIHTKLWQLEEGEGEKKVYARYYTDGVWGESFSDTILYELNNLCDVNNDGFVNVLDVQLCVNVILGVETTPAIVQKAKAVTEPIEECNVVDLQVIVNEILSS